MADEEPRWQRCSICREIPRSAHASWKHGWLQEKDLPEAAAKLAVVGAPYFNDYFDRCQCTKRCPECGTTYAFSRDYEFELAAMVDTIDVWLQRLDDVEGAAAVESAMAEVARRKQQSLIDGAAWVNVVLHSNDRLAVERAAYDLLHRHTHYGEDLAFAVPALVHALVHHTHTGGWTVSLGRKTRRCVFGAIVTGGLKIFAGCGDAQRQLVLESLKRLAPKEHRPETKDLLRQLRQR